jgi:hypothetical protein
VQPHAVVAHLEVIDHILPLFLPSSILTMTSPFPFQAAEAPFGDRISETVPLRLILQRMPTSVRSRWYA